MWTPRGRASGSPEQTTCTGQTSGTTIKTRKMRVQTTPDLGEPGACCSQKT